mgnify:CR=1 FL=1
MISELIFVFFILRFFIEGSEFSINRILNSISVNRMTLLLKYCIPIAMTTLCIWGQNISYRFIVDYKYSAEYLAYIAVGIGIATAIFTAMESVVMQYYNPIFLRTIVNATKHEKIVAWNKIASIATPIYLLTLVFILSTAHILVVVLVDDKFHGVYMFTMIAAGGEFFRVMTNMLTLVAHAQLNSKYMVKPYFIGSSIVLLVLYLYDFRENMYLIPITLTLGYALVFIVMNIEMNKLLSVNIVFDLRRFIMVIPFFVFALLIPIELPLINAVFYMAIFGLYYLISIWCVLKTTK